MLFIIWVHNLRCYPASKILCISSTLTHFVNIVASILLHALQNHTYKHIKMLEALIPAIMYKFQLQHASCLVLNHYCA